jgi:hypothetical protein
MIVGLFLSGLAYPQYHYIDNINWNKLQTVSEDPITTISNAIIIQIPGISGVSGDGHAAAATASSLAITTLIFHLQVVYVSWIYYWIYQRMGEEIR